MEAGGKEQRVGFRTLKVESADLVRSAAKSSPDVIIYPLACHNLSPSPSHAPVLFGFGDALAIRLEMDIFRNVRRPQFARDAYLHDESSSLEVSV